ncbi:hypothetical protein [Paraflavitalea speifideaquila]|uniref:hypothetical protein n=1 Tax=Paraflavitalea speifideaquila TaxID=3076558 RepID=UPI0028E9DAC9|nr:hypothetical protein [Paraflavitalea speifideiaquila]
MAAIYDATAPNVVVDFKVLPKPYGDTKNITFLSLEFIVYDFKLFESPTESVAGTVRNTFSFQPAQGTITTIREDLVLTGGLTPGFDVGAILYTDNTLKNWVYDIERRGFGTMEKNIDYRLTLDGVPEDSIAANGWELINDGDVFGDQEKFILHFQPQITAANTGGGGGGSANLVTGVAVLTNNIALDISYMKKLCLLQGGVGVTHFTVTLPPLSEVGENQQIGFVSEGGNHISATLDAAGSEVINFNGPKADINMLQGRKFGS